MYHGKTGGKDRISLNSNPESRYNSEPKILSKRRGNTKHNNNNNNKI